MASDRTQDLLKTFRTDATTAFLTSYRKAAGSVVGIWSPRILELLLLEKAAYQINYEAANRPQLAARSIHRMARLARRILGDGE
jgi:maltose alpha-D-glucosyltransferase / alpha-amylase